MKSGRGIESGGRSIIKNMEIEKQKIEKDRQKSRQRRVRASE